MRVFERWPEPYPLPRAVHLDHEVARILQGAGVIEALLPRTEAASSRTTSVALGMPGGDRASYHRRGL